MAEHYFVESLWRHPVKSMAAEKLSSASVTAQGLLGDRRYGVWDLSRGEVVSAKRCGSLLDFHPTFQTPPAAGEPAPPLEIIAPDGTRIDTDRDDVDGIMSRLLGRQVKLVAVEHGGLKTPVATLTRHLAPAADLDIAAAAPLGAFFDAALVHVLTTAAFQRLRELYPDGAFERPRFRPNIVVDGDGAGFVENAWIGHEIAIGDQVVLRATMPCPRCVMTTLAQGDLPHDPEILRTVARGNSQDFGAMGVLPCVGVYADVLRPGLIRPGDRVRVAVEF